MISCEQPAGSGSTTPNDSPFVGSWINTESRHSSDSKGTYTHYIEHTMIFRADWTYQEVYKETYDYDSPGTPSRVRYQYLKGTWSNTGDILTQKYTGSYESETPITDLSTITEWDSGTVEYTACVCIDNGTLYTEAYTRSGDFAGIVGTWVAEVYNTEDEDGPYGKVEFVIGSDRSVTKMVNASATSTFDPSTAVSYLGSLTFDSVTGLGTLTMNGSSSSINILVIGDYLVYGDSCVYQKQ